MVHQVVVLASDGVLPFELCVPGRVFGSAWSRSGERLYEVIVCSLTGAAVMTSEGFAITPAGSAELFASADTIVIPAATWHTGLQPGTLEPALTAALELRKPTTRLVSICLGSYLLAAAGYLDGLEATTHWSWADHFQQTFGSVQVDPSVLYIDTGSVSTSAGAAAGIDLCLHLIRDDHGSEIANDVARRCVVPPWRDGGQKQFIERPVPQGQLDELEPTRRWAVQRLDTPLQLDDLARHAGMSRRTFTRRFRAATGTSPNAWLLQQRIDLAREFLERSDLSVDRIAEASGFGSASALRKHLRTQTGASPSAYRRLFHD